MSKKKCKSEKRTTGADAQYTCRKCGLKAAKEKHLCKPSKTNKKK